MVTMLKHKWNMNLHFTRMFKLPCQSLALRQTTFFLTNSLSITPTHTHTHPLSLSFKTQIITKYGKWFQLLFNFYSNMKHEVSLSPQSLQHEILLLGRKIWTMSVLLLFVTTHSSEIKEQTSHICLSFILDSLCLYWYKSIRDSRGGDSRRGREPLQGERG